MQLGSQPGKCCQDGPLALIPLPIPLSTAKRLISRTCRSTWNNTHAAAHMDATTTVSKWSRSPSSPGEVTEIHEHSAKSSKCNARSFASVAASPPSPNARAVPPHQPQPLQPLCSKFIIFRSAEGNRCFVHPGKVTRAIYSSIFAKKYIEKILTITGGGRSIKLEVANLENLS